jgi:alpha-D-ribose 1-methylphosphonate 5-triphosphate synthase subunit PhnI
VFGNAERKAMVAAGFLSHLKLPYYVDFQSELGLVRKLRREHARAPATSVAEEATG